MPADPLQRLLESHEPRRPRIVWYDRDERIELTGHVLSMWQAKAAGLITAESGPGTPVHLGAPVHWRTLVWACGTWLAGRPVILGPPHEAGSAAADAGLEPAELSVALAEPDLDPRAEVQVLVPAASLAVRWPGRLPALVMDGAAELMSYADTFSAVPAAAGAPGLVQAPPQQAGGAGGRPGILTRAALAAGPEDARDARGARGQADSPGGRDGAGRGRAVMVRTSEPGRALREVLGAWQRGRTAVLVAPGADDALAAAAARQEGAGA